MAKTELETPKTGGTTVVEPTETPKTPHKVEKMETVADTTVVKTVQDMTFAEVIGSVTERMILALQNTDSGQKGADVASARGDLKLWYESQPMENRKEMARNTRKLTEHFRGVAEQINQDIQSLSFQDLG